MELRDPGGEDVTAAAASGRDGERERALAAVAGIEGWMTGAQLARLWNVAAAAPRGGAIVEIGSYRGRSTVVLARAAPAGTRVIAIDPHAGSDRGPGEIRGSASVGDRDEAAFRANLAAAAVADRVEHVRLLSQAAHDRVDGGIDVLHVDGAHRYGPARDDLARWGARLRPGGLLLLHDAFSSVGVTAAQLRLLLASRDLRYLGRTGSLAEYRREPMVPGERLRNAARQLAELPWFVRNVAVKVLLTLRLRRAARLLGAEGWPY